MRLPRPLLALALTTVLAVAGSLVAATPAVAADHPVTTDSGEILSVEASYPGFIWGVSAETSSLRLSLPPEVVELGLDDLGFTLTTISGNWRNGSYSSIGTATSEVVVGIDSLANYGGTDFTLSIFNYGSGKRDPVFDLPMVDRTAPKYLLLTAHLRLGNLGDTEALIPFDANFANSFIVTSKYGVDGSAVPARWGDTLTVSGPFADGASGLSGALRSADGGSTSKVSVTGTGASRSVRLPVTQPANVDWGPGTAGILEFRELRSGDTPSIVRNARVVIPLNLSPTSRIAGDDRFATAAAVASKFATATTAYIANGRNYPDALSAAPAAAHLAAPLLLVEQGALPQATKDQLLRLKPSRIVIAGGPAAVSTVVESQLEALYPGEQVDRISGANRYETSRKISKDAFGAGSTTNAFVATGSNFPDALAASAAAAHMGAPVVLVPGTDAKVDKATQDLLGALGTEKLYIAGGTAVVSQGIQNQLTGILGAGKVTRLAGAERYATAVKINSLFSGSTKAYFAVGTGYADALAGAALAGMNDAPLFTVPGNCVPASVLSALDDLGATDVTLFGGTAVLTSAVANLTSC